MIKRTVIVRPVGHFFHGFHFRTTSFGDVTPIVSLFHPTYVPRVNIPFGDMPEGHETGGADWSVADPDIGQKLIEGLGGDRLDALLRVDTPDKFLVWADHHDKSGSEYLRIYSHALMGRLARAIVLAERELEVDRRSAARGMPWAAASIRRLSRHILIFKSGQARTNRLLRFFERANARRIGVEPWWRWSPLVE